MAPNSTSVLPPLRRMGKTMHVRFDDTQGHVQEQDGRKVQ
jgi:hypothetical protein